jgi:protein-S-isoprenylcysteine O-methyltransferase Ste14
MLDVIRYSLYCVTITACLFGYGHTIISIFFKRPSLRWVDFTLIGWAANLICYSVWSRPVFEVVSYPQEGGLHVIDGPLFYFLLTTEFLLNLGYTFSIVNMGKRFGVMVDKGLVDYGFYNVVRHPSYTLEPLMFILVEINGVQT